MTFKEKFNDKIGKIVTKFTSVSQDENGDAEVEKTNRRYAGTCPSSSGRGCGFVEK